MRQVFTSPRLENVEAVAALLRDAGIEVKITEPRSYRGNRRRSFSYRTSEDAAPEPAVWIVRADDQPRGRQLLREAGLLDSSRGESSYLPLSVLERDKDAQASRKARRAMRLKLGLLVLIVAVIGLVFFGTRKPSPALATAPPAAPAVRHPAPVIVPQAADDLQDYRADVPTALARLLVETELAKRLPAQACIAIDGRDPAAQFMQSLQHADETAVFTTSRCPGGSAWDINVHDYMTDGSGRGSVHVMLDVDDARIVDVERDGERWQVLRVR
ncbi:MAG TPA: hypothetical protein VN205_03640 [Thermomonas sp.]|nr:hypothetical protein [Thermomonas sp.]